MPLLDIAIAQSSFQNYLGYTRVQLFVSGRVPNYSLLKCEERWVSLRNSFRNPGNVKFDVLHYTKPHREFLIKAVATLESKCLVHNKHGEKEKDVLPSIASSSTVHIESSSEDLEEIEEREKLRRMRISKANKGNTPWNKGRRHSPETLQRIRERTRLAMQNPKVKMKLASSGHAQSEETREKIAAGVRIGWQRRRERLLLQETCLFDWQNLIAGVARKGFCDEDELQWNSYEVLNEQLQQEWLDSIEYRKTMPRPKGSKRAPKSLEQRRKIAESIAAKWADPEYRSKVRSGLAKYHGTPEGAERKPRKKPSGEGQSGNSPKNKASKTERSTSHQTKVRPQQPKLKKRTTPKFKDPLASTKLEMLKSIRAQRAAPETNKNEALQRAKLLIEEAEKAAEALEVAAMKSPIAQASLMETRKLIAEAIQSIETIENRELASQADVPSGHQNYVEKNVEGITEDLHHKDQKAMNGIASLQSREVRDQDFDIYKLTMLDEMDMDYRLPTNLSGYELSKLDLESLTEKFDLRELKDQHHAKPNGAVRLNGMSSPNGAKLPNHQEHMAFATKTATKKWVRGRLVEVAEGE